MTHSRRRLAAHIIIINIIIIFSSTFLHETGHITAGHFAGCADSKIAVGNPLGLELPGVFVALFCEAQTAKGIEFLLGLSGFLFVIPVAIVLSIVLRKRPERNIALIVIGFSVVLSGIDLLLLAPSESVIYISLLVGVLIMCIGEVRQAAGYYDYNAQRKHAKKAAKRVSN